MIPDKYAMSITAKQSTIINIFTFISSLSLFYYFVFYINKVNQMRMKIKISAENELLNENDVIPDDEKPEDIVKYNELYGTILSYFEEKKPYCDPDFTISQLATGIESNTTYISRAIKLNADMNFNVFINTYRITMIKEMFDKGYQNTYTIKHIYTSSGFKQQTTFNKVFKQIEGITPTDYIKNIPERFTRFS